MLYRGAKQYCQFQIVHEIVRGKDVRFPQKDRLFPKNRLPWNRRAIELNTHGPCVSKIDILKLTRHRAHSKREGSMRRDLVGLANLFDLGIVEDLQREVRVKCEKRGAILKGLLAVSACKRLFPKPERS